jgi:hypothetical protein
VLLYDVTCTYFEGQAAAKPLAQRGYSRDHRPDCKQVCVASAANLTNSALAPCNTPAQILSPGLNCLTPEPTAITSPATSRPACVFQVAVDDQIALA